MSSRNFLLTIHLKNPELPVIEQVMGILIKEHPDNWGGIQVHSEDRLEEVFLISYSEKNDTKICWKRLKPLQ
jgi:hypothetical protein